MPGQFSTAVIQQATMAMAYTQADLEQRGYPEMVANAAVRRAAGHAESKTRQLSDGLRGPAYLEILRAELTNAAHWAGLYITGMAR